MNRVILLAEGLIDPAGATSFVEGVHMELGRVVRLNPSEALLAPFGLNADRCEVRLGPLRAASLKKIPNDRDVCLLLQYGSVDGGGAVAFAAPRNEQEVASISQILERLNRKSWWFFAGGAEGGLAIWEEGSLEHKLTPLERVTVPLHGSAPEGDGEKVLRQFIDDFRELAGKEDFNRVREDDGLAPLNLAWPAHSGLIPRLPNLPLSVGAPMHWISPRWEHEGLARLVGGSCAQEHIGFQTDWKSLVPKTPVTTLVTSDFQMAREHHREDRGAELFERIWKDFVVPRLGAERICLASWSAEAEGLALIMEPDDFLPNRVPFHEKALDDSKVPRVNLWECVRNCWSVSPPLVQAAPPFPS